MSASMYSGYTIVVTSYYVGDDKLYRYEVMDGGDRVHSDEGYSSSKVAKFAAEMYIDQNLGDTGMSDEDILGGLGSHGGDYIVSSKHVGEEGKGYTVHSNSDGTYGYTIDATGEYVRSYGSSFPTAVRASKEAKKANEAAEAAARVVVETVDKGGYLVHMTEDGKWAYTVKSTGVTKYGYGDKGAASSAGKAGVKAQSKKVLGQMGLSVDPGHDATEKLIGIYRNRLNKMFTEAHHDMVVKQRAFMARYEAENGEWLAKLSEGTVSDQQYRRWLRTQVTTSKWYSDMVESLSDDLVGVDKMAMEVLNGMLPESYATNFNFGTYSVGGPSTGVSFTLYDRSTVMVLVRDGKAPLLPTAEVDEGKDKKWNTRKLNSAVAQGVLQGESIDKVAARISRVAEMDYRGAMRSARTMMTSAQNGGRLDSYRMADRMGIKVRKQWVATLDSRTRDSHAMVDGEVVDLDEEFSNGLRYPADPGGSPEEVYNCRCTMVAVQEGQDTDISSGRINKTGMTYDEWRDSARESYEARAQRRRAQAEAAQVAPRSVGWEEYTKRIQEQSWGDIKDRGLRYVMDNLTEDERDKVNWYTGGSYSYINGYLRDLDNYRRSYRDDADFQRDLGVLSGAMSKVRTTEDLFLSRGTGFSGIRSLVESIGTEEVKRDPSLLVGRAWSDPGFLSTTIKYQGIDFEDKVLMHIYAPEGTNGAYIEGISKFPHEKEFLFNAGHPFVVTNAKHHRGRNNNEWEIWLQAVV